MADEFEIETYDDIAEFAAVTSTSEPSRDKAHTIRQEIAQKMSVDWTNNSAKYLAKKSLVNDIRNAFHSIHKELSEFDEKFGSRTGKLELMEYTERLRIQHFVDTQMGIVSHTNILFWEEFARRKDRLSYKFGSRTFPTGTEKWRESFTNDTSSKTKLEDSTPDETEETEETDETDLVVDDDLDETTPKVEEHEEGNPEKKDKKDKKEKTKVEKKEKTKEERIREANELQRQTMEKIAIDYDMSTLSLRSFLDRSYVEEDANSTFQPLDPREYYDLVSLSDLEHIFSLCHKHYLYSAILTLWCHLVTSKQFVHLILGSNYILDLIFNPSGYNHEILDGDKVRIVAQNPFKDPKYHEICSHYLFYGLYLLNREEVHTKTHAVEGQRTIMDLRCVAKIPPYEGNLESNPFIPATLSDKYLYGLGTESQNNVIRPIRASPLKRGLYSLESFKARFQAFTSDLFDGLNYNKLYFTGSMIAACTIRNPLEQKFGIDLPRDSDALFSETPEKKASLRAYWLSRRKALTNYFDEYYPSKNVVSMQGMSLVEVVELEERLTDIDIIVDTLHDDDFSRTCLYVLGVMKRNLQARLGRAPSNLEINIVRIDTDKSYKFRIYGTQLPRVIELFRIYELRPIGCVSRFHFGCVRGYYDGNTVNVLPSMLCTANTGVCLDYKWFSNSSKPQMLICKYYTRGFYVLLNNEEQSLLRKFIEENPAYASLFRSDGERERSVSITDPIFNPREQLTSSYMELANKYGTRLVQAPALKYVQDHPRFDNIITPKAPVSVYGPPLKYRFPAGHIKPMELWYLVPYVRDLGRSQKYSF